jgi:DNA (cytosine-5)-methyltransferase 1
MRKELNELALFAGAGGGILGTKLLGWRTIAAVELNEYRRSILIQRQEDRLLDFFPIWDDIRTFDGRPFCGRVDIVTGGFPCQPYSQAGSKRGESDSRNLWPDTIRVIREIRPRYCLMENVDDLISYNYFGNILADLATSGYSIRYDIIPAAAVGANHTRRRLWIAAYSNNYGQPVISRLDEESRMQETTRNSFRARLEGLLRDTPAQRWSRAQRYVTETTWWSTESGVCGVDDGVANRVDRIKAIGLGQVPAVVRAAWHFLGDSCD